jgi:threonine synthase
MKYNCALCGNTYNVSDKIFRCTCGGFLELSVSKPFPKDLKGRGNSIWRYREAFSLPKDTKEISLGEGRTPVLHRCIDKNSLYFKLEYMQPSGSFKDRGASVLMSLINTLNKVTEVVEDSSGNAGASISAYSAAAGKKCTIFTPDYTPAGKLTQIQGYGARVIKVLGNREQSSIEAIKAANTAMYASHLWNPYFISGMQSSAFEIWEEFGESLPPVIIVPVGSGGLLEGLFSGFTALKEWGYINRIPALVGVQTVNCSPIHSAFLKGADDIGDIEFKPTLAEGIAVPKPPRARAVLNAIRKSGGVTIEVAEKNILSAFRRMLGMGLFVEPTSAVVFAAWLQMDLKLKENALLLLTGSGLKETAKISDLLNDQ